MFASTRFVMPAGCGAVKARLKVLREKAGPDHISAKQQLQQALFGSELQEDVPIFAFVGRITEQKGVHLIVNTVEELVRKFPFYSPPGHLRIVPATPHLGTYALCLAAPAVSVQDADRCWRDGQLERSVFRRLWAQDEGTEVQPHPLRL